MTSTVTTTIVRPRVRGALNVLADLRLRKGDDGDIVLLHGHTSAMDGGQGLFYWDSDRVEEDDGGTVVLGWVRIYTGRVEAAWFGATGVYAADWSTIPDANSDAVEAADAVGPVHFARIPGIDGYTIYQLGRTFAPTMRSGVVFSCDPGVVLYHTNTANDPTAAIVYLDGGDYPLEEFSATIDRAILRGAPTAVAAGAKHSKYGLRMRGVHQLELRHVDVMGVTDDAFRLEGCTSITPFNVRSSVNVEPTWWSPVPVNGFAIYDRDGDPAGRSSTMSVAINMIMEGHSGAGFYASENASQWMLAGGTLEACGIGAHVEASCGWFVFDNLQHVDNTECDYKIDGFGCEVRSPVSSPATRTVASIDLGTDVITTSAAHGYSIGDGPLTLSSTGTAPSGLAQSTLYWVASAPSSTTLTLAASLGGPVVDIADVGTGVHTLRAASVKLGAAARANLFTGGYYYGAIYSESDKSQRYEIMQDDAACVVDAATIGRDSRVWVNDSLGSHARWTTGQLPAYADNAAALAGGLEPGDTYRVGADVKVVT